FLLLSRSSLLRLLITLLLPLISLVFFLLLSYRAPLHLRSFPTRRSSDLQSVLHVVRLKWHTCYMHAFSDDKIHFHREYKSGFHVDRKSTRLNSSHVSISYAVFCLKKKKEHVRPDVCDYYSLQSASIAYRG